MEETSRSSFSSLSSLSAILIAATLLLQLGACVGSAPTTGDSQRQRRLVSTTSPIASAVEISSWAVRLAAAEGALAAELSVPALREIADDLASARDLAFLPMELDLRIGLWLDGVAESHGVEQWAERRLQRGGGPDVRAPVQRRAVVVEQGGGSAERWAMPLATMRITSPYGPRIHPITGERGRVHHGVDYGAATGTEVYASASGEVLLAGWCGRGPGNCVVIEHAQGWRSQYFHLSSWSVRAGQQVRQGAGVGRVGATGSATGPHLHYQVGVDGRSTDPEPLWDKPVGQPAR